MSAPDVQEVAQYIAEGEYDGELLMLLESIQIRFQTGRVATQWEVDWDDLHVTEADLLLNEAWQIEKVANASWLTIDPTTSANHCKAILSVCLASRCGLTPSEVEAKLSTLTADGIIKKIKKTEVVPAPLDTEASPSI